MDHTKEPWDYVEIEREGEASIHPVCDDEWTVAICCDGVMSEHSANANARRIVACVNACAGMGDPSAGLSSLRAALAKKTVQVEMLREALTNIYDYGLDRDGETTPEKLGALVDELVQLAREALAATDHDNIK